MWVFIWGFLLACFCNSHILLALQHVEGNWHISEYRVVKKNFIKLFKLGLKLYKARQFIK